MSSENFRLWQDCCHYLYLPRMVRDDVYKNAINLGLHSEDFFGFASGKSDSKYLGFIFGDSASIILDESSLLISRDAAKAYKDSQTPIEQIPTGDPGDDKTGKKTVIATPPTPGGFDQPPVTFPKKSFYGTVNLDPVRAKFDFATIVDEVVQQFTSNVDVNVEISIEIRASSKHAGFNESVQRSIKENCNVLKFGNAEFE